MACDERGTTRWPSSSKTWAIGGFIVEEGKRQMIVSAWRNVKLKLCGNQDCELKWSDFFPGHHQKKKNPLLSSDPREWREQAVWAISELFNATSILPVNTVVRKDEASSSTFITTKDGRQILDVGTLWVAIIAQFALFLTQHNSKGEIWLDQLGSREEESRKQAEWKQLRSNKWPVNPENQVLIQRIAPTLRFLDSQIEPLVQIADFVSGVIWAASEGEDDFLSNALNKYFPSGPRTYTLVHIE